MTDGEVQHFPPMHPVTRLGRVIQQLRSFDDLHAGELEAFAAELDTANAAELAARLRTYREIQRDEAHMIVDELVDLRADLALTGQAELVAPAELTSAVHQGEPAGSGGSDPAINSPRRARWLAEQAAEEERRRQPLSRRDFFGGGAQKPAE